MSSRRQDQKTRQSRLRSAGLYSPPSPPSALFASVSSESESELEVGRWKTRGLTASQNSWNPLAVERRARRRLPSTAWLPGLTLRNEK